MPDSTKIDIGGGRNVWVMDTEGTPFGSKLSVSVVDGVLLGCLSSDPMGVGHLVDRVQKQAVVVPELQERLTRKAGKRSEDRVFDRGWVRWRRDEEASPPSGRLSYELTWHEEKGSAGRLWCNERLPPASHLGVAFDVAELEQVLGPAADAVIIMPYSILESLLLQPGAPAVLQSVDAVVKAGGGNQPVAFAALFGGDYSGRILGMKVPTVMLGVKLMDCRKALASVGGALDRVNMEHGWGLIPDHAEVDGVPVTVLNSTRAGVYSSMKSRERPALATTRGWLILSSCTYSLAKLLGDVQKPERAKTHRTRWVEGLDTEVDAAYAWADLESTGGALRNAIAVYSLVLLAQNSEGSQRTRAVLNHARAWIDAVRPLRTCVLRLAPVGESGFEVRFRLAEDCGGEKSTGNLLH